MRTIAIAVLLFSVSLVSACVPGGTFQAVTTVLVIPFSAGGSNDLIGRYLADQLSRHWGETIVVENRPGAGSALGSAYVAKAAPDGRTLLFVSSSLTTMTATAENLPFSPMDDLQPVGLAAVGQSVVVTGSRVPMPTLATLIDQAKARTLFFGTAGVGTTSHLGAELLNNSTGIDLTAVHYRGATNAMIDMAGGRLDVYVGAVASLMSSIRAGTAVPVAIVGRQRDAALPGVPTMAESGYPDTEADVWWGVFAPAATPRPVVDRINAGINIVMGTPEAQRMLERSGATPGSMTVEAFEDLVSQDHRKWVGVVEARGIAAN